MKLLTPIEAAERLGLKEKTIRDWIYKRKIPVVHISARAVRISDDVIDELIKRSTVPAN